MTTQNKPNAPVPLMPPHRFVEKVNEYAKIHHMVLFTEHATEQMQKRDITRRMVLRALAKGTLAGGPKWDATKGNWVGKIEGAAAGVRVSVVCAIRDGAMTITVITTY